MPNRVIREGFIDSESVNALSESAEVFYHRLMLIVDDYGRYEADPLMLMSKLFWRQPERWSAEKIKHALHECSTCGADDTHLISVYRVGKKLYLQINNFRQVLRAKHEKYPGPEKGVIERLADAEHMQSTCTASAPHLLADENRIGIGIGIEEKRIEEKRIIPIPKTDDTLADFTDELYGMGQPAKRKNKVLAEQEIAKAVSRCEIGPGGVDFATVKSRWKAANESNDWAWLDGAKAQTLAEWVGDGNYKYPTKGISSKSNQPHPAFIRSAL